MALFDRYKKTADKTIESDFSDNKTLRHKLTGNVGIFIKEYQPTGKSLTTQIQLDDGKTYFAPSHEFELIKTNER
jgi:hypothetical protein